MSERTGPLGKLPTVEGESSPCHELNEVITFYVFIAQGQTLFEIERKTGQVSCKSKAAGKTGMGKRNTGVVERGKGGTESHTFKKSRLSIGVCKQLQGQRRGELVIYLRN